MVVDIHSLNEYPYITSYLKPTYNNQASRVHRVDAMYVIVASITDDADLVVIVASTDDA